jgi:hypothetical protein
MFTAAENTRSLHRHFKNRWMPAIIFTDQTSYTTRQNNEMFNGIKLQAGLNSQLLIHKIHDTD